MARTILKDKTALILGVDNPTGRAAAMQLSRAGCRVIAAGFSEKRIEQLVDLLIHKHGQPLDLVLTEDTEAAMKKIRYARDYCGHVHFFINCLAAGEELKEDPEPPARLAREYHAPLVELLNEKSTARTILVWPERAGEFPEEPQGVWHAIVRVENLQLAVSRDERPEKMVPAAGLADTLVYLLSCPPSAQPREVRIASG